MRGKLAIFGGVVLSMVFAVAAIGGTVPSEAPDTVMIDDCVNKKAAVEFPHKAHWGLTECSTCHHTQEGLAADSTDEVQACGECHVEPAEEGTPACSQMSSSKNPFHITCVGCHKEKKAEDEASAAPTKCDECHPKAE